ncbi:MAG: DUF6314 family protein [Pseudomonadota bacterium]
MGGLSLSLACGPASTVAMVEATQSYFEGPWQMVRIIENLRDGVIGEVWGQVEFLFDGEGLTCLESGVLRFQGVDYHTGRTSLWRFDGDRIEVQYEDGRPFHDFLTQDPIALQIDGDARYEITYDFDPGTWTSRWEMLGPGADYMMTTRYRR